MCVKVPLPLLYIALPSPLMAAPGAKKEHFRQFIRKLFCSFSNLRSKAVGTKKRAIRGHHQSAAEAESSSSPGRDGCSQKEENIRTCRAHRSWGSLPRPHYFIACHLNKYAGRRAHLRYTFVSLPLLSYTRKKKEPENHCSSGSFGGRTRAHRDKFKSLPPPLFPSFLSGRRRRRRSVRGGGGGKVVSLAKRLPPNSRGGE